MSLPYHMPARPASERTSYVYDRKRDKVKLTVEGVPPLVLYLDGDMLKEAAKTLKLGREGKLPKAEEKSKDTEEELLV